VTDRYKLVRFYGTNEDYWELFDRQKDPLELKSVYDEPAYAKTKAELEKELARLRRELKVPDEVPPHWLGNQSGGAPKKGKQGKQQPD
jgi:hypothetical protein